MRLPRLPHLLPVVLLAFVAGCGGDAGGGGKADADPAQAVPASASVYLEVVVRPEGDQKEQLTKLAGKVLRTPDPAAKIEELADKAFSSEGETVTYETHFKPWLGRRAGISLSNFQADDPTFIVAVAAKDAGKAKELLDTESKASGDKKASYNGVDYWIDKESEAAGIVGDYLVAASNEAELKRSIDASKGEALGDTQKFKDALDKLPDDRAGMGYLDLGPLISGIAKSEADPQIQQVFGALGLDKLGPIGLALLADENTVAIESATKKPAGGKAGGLFSPLAFDAPELIKELPGDTFAAFGTADLGGQAKGLFQTFAGVLGGAALGGQLESELGLSLENDVFAWLGDVALFVRGDSVATIDGGLVISVKDPAKATAGLTKLVGLAQQRGGIPLKPASIDGASLAFAASDPQLPKPIVVALAGERAVIAFGEEAAKAGLNPAEKLGDADLYSRAKEQADDLEPTLLLDGPGILRLVETAVAGNVEYAQAKPYLDMIDVIVAAYKLDGDTARQRFAVGIK